MAWSLDDRTGPTRPLQVTCTLVVRWWVNSLQRSPHGCAGLRGRAGKAAPPVRVPHATPGLPTDCEQRVLWLSWQGFSLIFCYFDRLYSFYSADIIWVFHPQTVWHFILRIRDRTCFYLWWSDNLLIHRGFNQWFSLQNIAFPI